MLDQRVIYEGGFVVVSARTSNGLSTGGTGFIDQQGWSTGYVTTAVVQERVRRALDDCDNERRFRQDMREFHEAFASAQNWGLGHVPVELRAPWPRVPIGRPPAVRAHRLAAARRPVHARRERLPVRSRPGRRRRRAASA